MTGGGPSLRGPARRVLPLLVMLCIIDLPWAGEDGRDTGGEGCAAQAACTVSGPRPSKPPPRHAGQGGGDSLDSWRGSRLGPSRGLLLTPMRGTVGAGNLVT